MPVFQYRALQGDGTIAEGQIEAGGRQEAFRQIEGRGLRPIKLAENKNGTPQLRERKEKALPAEKSNGQPAPFKLPLGGANKVTARMLENFTRLLSSLLAAGVPLSRALVILTKEASTPAAQAKWREVNSLVVDGMSLADAMAKSPDT